MTQKVTTMVLKVDLDCSQCYRKIKKLLCKFPQIRDQVFDEKNNTVIITVVCCSPEKIRDKLCCKGGKTIKSIEIKQPNKPKPAPAPAPAEPEKPKPKPVPAPVPAEPEKPKSVPAPAPEPEKPKPAPDQKPPEKMQKNGSKKPDSAPKPKEPEAQWVPGFPPGPPPQTVIPVSICCVSCYEGRPGGPCYGGGGPGPWYPYGYYGRPPPPPPRYCTSRCDYFSEENPAACSIM